MVRVLIRETPEAGPEVKQIDARTGQQRAQGHSIDPIFIGPIEPEAVAIREVVVGRGRQARWRTRGDVARDRVGFEGGGRLHRPMISGRNLNPR